MNAEVDDAARRSATARERQFPASFIDKVHTVSVGIREHSSSIHLDIMVAIATLAKGRHEWEALFGLDEPSRARAIIHNVR